MVSNTESENKPKKKKRQTLNTNFAYISYNVHLYVYYGLIFSRSWIRVIPPRRRGQLSGLKTNGLQNQAEWVSVNGNILLLHEFKNIDLSWIL